MADLKMYAVFSREALKLMNGNRGKLAAQAGHAYMHTFWDAEKRFPEAASQYRNDQRAYKIGLIADFTEEVIEQLRAYYEPWNGFTVVEDAAFTVFDKPTITCIGIGPIDPDNRDEFLKACKVLI